MAQSALMRPRIDPVSPVRVIDDVRADLAPALRAIILDASARRALRQPSANVGGWKSSLDFLAWPHDAIRELAAVLASRVGAPIAKSWAMVNRAGSHHKWHHHDGVALSGVYYVACGDPAIATQFRVDGEIVECVPRVGRLALFGGALWHRVPVYDGTEPRVTIAFDVA